MFSAMPVDMQTRSASHCASVGAWSGGSSSGAMGACELGTDVVDGMTAGFGRLEVVNSKVSGKATQRGCVLYRHGEQVTRLYARCTLLVVGIQTSALAFVHSRKWNKRCS